VNRQKLLKYLHQPESLQTKHVAMLSEMAEQYPYASAIRALLAKAGQTDTNSRNLLATAALYSPNRRALREFMEADRPAEPQPPTQETDSTYTAPAANEQVSPHQLTTESDSVPTANEIPTETSEPNFEENTEVTVEYQSTELEQTEETFYPTEQPAVKYEEAESTAEESEVTQPTEETPATPKVDIFKELEENLRRLRDQRNKLNADLEDGKPESSTLNESSPEAKVEEKSEAAAPAPIKVNETLQEIIHNHPERNLENDRVVFQRNLIRDFLNKSERISRPSPNLDSAPTSDLSANSATTPPDLVTETLANIMVRQGKFERAIDIYEKLILKYPQKSTYFAGRIDQLKNDL
jgi:tetratricopeptide (TPR) repeat protein